MICRRAVQAVMFFFMQAFCYQGFAADIGYNMSIGSHVVRVVDHTNKFSTPLCIDVEQLKFQWSYDGVKPFIPSRRNWEKLNLEEANIVFTDSVEFVVEEYTPGVTAIDETDLTSATSHCYLTKVDDNFAQFMEENFNQFLPSHYLITEVEPDDTFLDDAEVRKILKSGAYEILKQHTLQNASGGGAKTECVYNRHGIIMTSSIDNYTTILLYQNYHENAPVQSTMMLNHGRSAFHYHHNEETNVTSIVENDLNSQVPRYFVAKNGKHAFLNGERAKALSTSDLVKLWSEQQ